MDDSIGFTIAKMGDLPLSQRIVKAQKLIQEIHKETVNQLALNSNISSDSDVKEVDVAVGARSMQLKPGQIPKKTSLELSMALFGKLNNSAEGEAYIQQRLSELETELHNVVASLRESEESEYNAEGEVTSMEDDLVDDSQEYWTSRLQSMPDRSNPTATIYDMELLQLQCLFLRHTNAAVATLDSAFHRTGYSISSINSAASVYSPQAQAIVTAATSVQEARKCYHKQHDRRNRIREAEECKRNQSYDQRDSTVTIEIGTEPKSIWIMLTNNNAMIRDLENRLERHSVAVEAACTTLLKSMISIESNYIAVHLGGGNKCDPSSGLLKIRDSWEALLLLGESGLDSGTSDPPPLLSNTSNNVTDNFLWEMCNRLYNLVFVPLINPQSATESVFQTQTLPDNAPEFSSICKLVETNESWINDGKTVKLEWQVICDYGEHDELANAMERSKRKTRQARTIRKDLSIIQEVGNENETLNSSQEYGNPSVATPSHSEHVPQFAQQWKSLLEALQKILSFLHQYVFVDTPSFSASADLHANLTDTMNRQPFMHNSILPHKVGTHFFVPSKCLQSVQDSDVLTPTYKTKLSVTDLLKFHFFYHCLPLSPNVAAQACDFIVNATNTFEAFLLKHSFLGFSDSNKSESHRSRKDNWLLRDHIQDFAIRYSERCRHEVLVRARWILTKGSDFHTTRIVGDQDESLNKNSTRTQEERDLEHAKSIFRLPICAISEVAYHLFEHVKETMEKACMPAMNDLSKNTQSHDKLQLDHSEHDHTVTDVTAEQLAIHLSQESSAYLYRASRECLDLYRAIIPSIYQKELYSLPRMAAICHNDCIYLAHKCTTLGIIYQDRLLKEELKHLCSFLDMVPLFREMGDKVMMEMMKRENEQLDSMVSKRLIGWKNSLALNEVRCI